MSPLLIYLCYFFQSTVFSLIIYPTSSCNYSCKNLQRYLYQIHCLSNVPVCLFGLADKTFKFPLHWVSCLIHFIYSCVFFVYMNWSKFCGISSDTFLEYIAAHITLLLFLFFWYDMCTIQSHSEISIISSK